MYIYIYIYRYIHPFCVVLFPLFLSASSDGPSSNGTLPFFPAKRRASVGLAEGRATTSVGLAEGRATTSVGLAEGRATTSAGLAEDRATTSVGLVEGRATTSVGLAEGRATTSVGLAEGRATSSVGLAEEPSMCKKTGGKCKMFVKIWTFQLDLQLKPRVLSFEHFFVFSV